MAKRYRAKIVDELTKQNNRMAIIQQIAKSINVEMTYEEIINEVAAPLSGVLSYDLLSFILMEKGQLIVKASIPKEPEILKMGFVYHRVIARRSGRLLTIKWAI